MTASLLHSFETEKLALYVRQKLLAYIDCCVENSGRYLTMDGSLAKYGGFAEGFATTLATFYGKHDRFNDFEKLFLKALSVQKEILGYESIATLATLNNLGALYLDARQLEDAKGYLSQSLQVKEYFLGPHHPRTLNSVNNIGNLLVLQHQFDEATLMYCRTLEGYTELKGATHRTVLEALNNIGEVAMKTGKYEEAENAFVEVLTKTRKLSGGKDDSLILYIASNVALVYKLQERHQESIQVYEEVVAGRASLVGEKHSSTLQSMCEVADVYKALGDDNSAKEWYHRGQASEERRHRGHPAPELARNSITEATMDETRNISHLRASNSPLIERSGLRSRQRTLTTGEKLQAREVRIQKGGARTTSRGGTVTAVEPDALHAEDIAESNTARNNVASIIASDPVSNFPALPPMSSSLTLLRTGLSMCNGSRREGGHYSRVSFSEEAQPCFHESLEALKEAGSSAYQPYIDRGRVSINNPAPSAWRSISPYTFSPNLRSEPVASSQRTPEASGVPNTFWDRSGLPLICSSQNIDPYGVPQRQDLAQRSGDSIIHIADKRHGSSLSSVGLVEAESDAIREIDCSSRPNSGFSLDSEIPRRNPETNVTHIDRRGAPSIKHLP
jgi:tetratricopeptide (TPR) repeat protein